MDTTTTNTGAGALIVMALSALISSGLLGAAFLALRRYLDGKIGVDNTRLAVQVVGEAVKAAEQIGKVHGLDPQTKYLEASRRSRDILAQHGIAIGDQQMRTLVEGAVTQIKQADQAGQSLPGVVLTGDSPTVNAAPPVPSGPSPEQLIAAITTAIGAVFPVAPQPAPVQAVLSAEAVPVAASAVQTVPLGAPTT